MSKAKSLLYFETTVDHMHSHAAIDMNCHFCLCQ